MKKSKKIMAGLIGIFVLLLVLPFLIPTEKYLAEFEREVAALLGVPVDIENAHIYFIPSPRLSVEGIAIGQSQDITVQSVTVIPSLWSLFSSSRTFALNVHQPVIKDTAMPFVSKLMASKSNTSTHSSIEISQVDVDGLTLIWPSVKLPMFDLQVVFSKGMQLSTAEAKSEDGQLEMNIQPNEAGYSIVVNMDDWLIPLSHPWQVNQGRVDMALVNQTLDVSSMSLQMYGGTINGHAKLDWQKNWQLNGKIEIKDLSLAAPTKMMNPNTYLGGSLLSKGKFSANAKNADQLLNQLSADFVFTVNQGVLYGLDLVKVASLLVKQSAKGGQTQFDTFTGELAVSGKRYHLKRMQVSSGLISAKGDVQINEQDKLDGAGEVEIKRSVGLVSVPLIVAGTLDKPLVYPSKAALAGAAVGTAILGPGLGTSLGSKAGSAVSGLKDLFGGGEK
ncbi:MAG: AsmA-like C-terminal region-containing protein [Methylophilus sp.]|nr:AsmA-like C-terminal region-containing protein [Methylophilus sp.]